MNKPIIANDIDRIRREMAAYRTNLYKRVGDLGLTVIDNNFRAQGWQGNTLIPWKPTKSGKRNTFGRKPHAGILIGTGRLRRSIRTNSPGVGMVRWSTDVPYAKRQNEGFNGMESVKGFTRRRMARVPVASVKTHRNSRIKAQIGESEVRPFTRHANTPRRQFMPTTKNPSRIFSKTIWNTIDNDIKRIFKPRP